MVARQGSTSAYGPQHPAAVPVPPRLGRWVGLLGGRPIPCVAQSARPPCVPRCSSLNFAPPPLPSSGFPREPETLPSTHSASSGSPCKKTTSRERVRRHGTSVSNLFRLGKPFCPFGVTYLVYLRPRRSSTMDYTQQQYFGGAQPYAQFMTIPPLTPSNSHSAGSDDFNNTSPPVCDPRPGLRRRDCPSFSRALCVALAFQAPTPS